MPHVKVKINNTTIKMVIDTGASIDILDETTFNALQKKEKIELSRSKTKLFAYGSSEQLPILGKFDSTIETKDKITYSCLHVVKGNAGSSMSYEQPLHLCTRFDSRQGQQSSHKAKQTSYTLRFRGSLSRDIQWHWKTRGLRC